jgi:hypothetical protein
MASKSMTLVSIAETFAVAIQVVTSVACNELAEQRRTITTPQVIPTNVRRIPYSEATRSASVSAFGRPLPGAEASRRRAARSSKRARSGRRGVASRFMTLETVLAVWRDVIPAEWCRSAARCKKRARSASVGVADQRRDRVEGSSSGEVHRVTVRTTEGQVRGRLGKQDSDDEASVR